ncbi:hypothetical protein ABS71_13880 [bacterium SCN 62-11]|nr:hypothetical protein [Candidatus Eremiobacteraeota bacterium]ODT63825.1 MAG: hypothetical protein ABS71_13880 [bacterium SCN 62-11]
MRSTRGLTLAELLLAFLLITIVGLLMGGLFLQLLQGSAKRSDLTVGQVFAEATLEEVVQAGLYGANSGRLEQGLYSHDLESRTQFFYQVTSTESACPPPSTKRGYLLRIEVWWWSGEAGRSRAGVGLTSTRLSRWVVP